MARIPMFLNIKWKSPQGEIYQKLICNDERGGCGEEFWSGDKVKHRNHCFKNVENKGRKRSRKEQETYDYWNH